MIEKMKKFTFLVTDREYDGFIDAIRDLGVVHVTQLQQGATSPELQEAMSMEQRYRAAMDFLAVAGKKYAKESATEAPKLASPVELLQRVEQLQAQEKELMVREVELEREKEQLEPWGNFDPDALARLAQDTGMEIHFFACRPKSFRQEWVKDYFAIRVCEEKKRVYFVTFSATCPEIQAEHISLPDKSLQQVKVELARTVKNLSSVRGEMVAIDAAMRPMLATGQLEMQNEISLSRVHLSDERTCGDVLRLMIGWVRADSTDALVAYLDGEHIYYAMEDPAFNDDVPVQLSNGRFSSLFEPIMKMYSLPNYNDLDPTTFFAPFFMLFFGLCMGDAGYGMLIMAVGLYLAFKGSADMKAYGRLAMWLGGSTIVCGLASGTLFGIDLSQQDWVWVQPIKPYLLNDNGVGPIFGYSPMMVFSVAIGLVQVLLGMLLKGCKAIKNYGWPYAVGTFSWVVAIIALVALMGLPACGVVLPEAAQYVLEGITAVCAVGIFLYNNPASYKKPALGLLSNIGGGVWETYSMATGLLGDLLSYIRLFALGLTGGVLGGVFNTLAMDMTASMDLVPRILVMVLILLLGHGITFALSMISAFVHPMRLTFVEFFKNADFSGGGKAYAPFRRIKNNE